jgi:hypothetical protein
VPFCDDDFDTRYHRNQCLGLFAFFFVFFFQLFYWVLGSMAFQVISLTCAAISLLLLKTEKADASRVPEVELDGGRPLPASPGSSEPEIPLQRGGVGEMQSNNQNQIPQQYSQQQYPQHGGMQFQQQMPQQFQQQMPQQFQQQMPQQMPMARRMRFRNQLWGTQAAMRRPHHRRRLTFLGSRIWRLETRLTRGMEIKREDARLHRQRYHHRVNKNNREEKERSGRSRS